MSPWQQEKNGRNTNKNKGPLQISGFYPGNNCNGPLGVNDKIGSVLLYDHLLDILDVVPRYPDEVNTGSQGGDIKLIGAVEIQLLFAEHN